MTQSKCGLELMLWHDLKPSLTRVVLAELSQEVKSLTVTPMQQLAVLWMSDLMVHYSCGSLDPCMSKQLSF